MFRVDRGSERQLEVGGLAGDTSLASEKARTPARPDRHGADARPGRESKRTGAGGAAGSTERRHPISLLRNRAEYLSAGSRETTVGEGREQSRRTGAVLHGNSGAGSVERNRFRLLNAFNPERRAQE